MNEVFVFVQARPRQDWYFNFLTVDIIWLSTDELWNARRGSYDRLLFSPLDWSIQMKSNQF